MYEENEYQSFPMQLNGEQTNLSIKFIPKDSSSGLQSYSVSTLIFPKIDTYWTIGPMIYHAGFTQQRVLSEKVNINDSTQVYNVSEGASLEGEIGTALLLRAGKMMKSSFGLHAAIGTGVSLGENVQPRALAGVGLSLGDRNKLSIDVGGIMGYVKKISAKVDLTQDFAEKPDVLINALESTYFIGLGYHFKF